MSRSGTNTATKKVLLQSKPFISGLHLPPLPSQPEVMNSPTSDLDDVTLLRRYAQMAREHLSTLPSSCPLLSPEDVELVGGRPVAAGGFSDIRKAKRDGRNVVLKAYRCYRSFDIAQVFARFCHEVHVCGLLRHGDAGVVQLVGAYSTDTHPFGLVYEYMDSLDLKQYLRNEPNVGRLKLLTEVARCLNCMHDLGIVHGNFQTANILVDKDGTPRIGGLGNAHILSHSTAWIAEGGTSTEQLSRSRAPELVRPDMSPTVTGGPHPTKASDMYAFGVMAFEILTGRPPFFGTTELAATYSMLSGSRPSRPDHHEVSDSVWRMIGSCWNGQGSERMPIEEVVALLQAEQSSIPTPGV